MSICFEKKNTINIYKNTWFDTWTVVVVCGVKHFDSNVLRSKVRKVPRWWWTDDGCAGAIKSINLQFFQIQSFYFSINDKRQSNIKIGTFYSFRFNFDLLSIAPNYFRKQFKITNRLKILKYTTFQQQIISHVHRFEF